MSDSRGITTIELIVVLAVIGVLGAIAFVILPRDRFAVNQAAEGLIGDVQLARFQAIRTGGYIRLAMDPTANRYRLLEVVWDDTNKTWVEGDVLKVVEMADNRTPQVKISSDSTFNDLFYDPRGNAIGQGSQTIVLESTSSDYARTVAISQQGRAEIQ